jgi:hypothetical protein
MLGVGMNACKSVKSGVPVALSPKSKNERLDMLVNQAVQYETFSSRLSLSIRLGEKNKTAVDGQLKIIKDRAIQLSLKIPLLGTEAFRLTLTPDEIIIIDRINKQYLVEQLNVIREKAPFDFDFYSFQALLGNQLFIAGKDRIAPEDYPSFRIQEDAYQTHIENTDRYNTAYSFTSDFTHRILNTQMSKEEWQSEMSWQYDNFGLTDNKKLFPMTMKMDLALPNDRIQMKLSFHTVQINSTFDLDYNYPQKYKQVSLPDILQLIKNLP